MTTTQHGTGTVVTLRPRYESANIRTWIGFKQFLRLAEDAVLAWFRERDLGPHLLYHRHGLGLSVVDSSALLPAVLEVDDEVRATVHETRPGRFAVRLEVDRAGVTTGVLRGHVTVVLVREADPPAVEPAPPQVRALTVAGVADCAGPLPEALPPGAGATHGWSWTARYPSCQYSHRVQHGAYVTVLEETVDRFLAARGISVGHMLDSRGWIPVVSRVRVRLLADAYLEERVHTDFTVEAVVKDRAFDGRMDCRVERAGVGMPVATAQILHGYAVSRGPAAGTLATFEPDTVAALLGTGR